MNNKLIILIIGVIIGVLVSIGIYFVFFFKTSLRQQLQFIKFINTFEECVEAGYPTWMTYPKHCKTPDGRIFYYLGPDVTIM